MKFQSASFPEYIKYYFQNGNISPEISFWLYKKKKVSVRPDYLVVGRNGWLFLGDRFQNVVSKATGEFAFDEQILGERWADQLKKRQDWLQSKGIISLFVIAPNKHSIYPEQSPIWLDFDKASSTKKLIDSASSKGVHLVDPSMELIAEKRATPWLYNRSDTHWSYPGAFVSYQKVMETLSQFALGLEFLSQDDLTFTRLNSRETGITRFLGFPKNRPGIKDWVYKQKFKAQLEASCIIDIDDNFVAGTECNTDSSLASISSNRTAKEVRNVAGLNHLSLLLVEDSFGEAPAEYYNRSFIKTWHVHSSLVRGGNRLKRFVEIYRPDIVVFRIVERNLLHPIAYEFDGESELIEPIVE